MLADAEFSYGGEACLIILIPTSSYGGEACLLVRDASSYAGEACLLAREGGCGTSSYCGGSWSSPILLGLALLAADAVNEGGGGPNVLGVK